MEAFHLDFLIIGTEKSGTTSLIQYLMNHPDVHRNKNGTKSSYFFSIYFNNGIEWYKEWFGSHGNKKIGERDHDLIYYYRASMRVKQVTPNTKFILMLRNPIDRAYSHWNENIKNPSRNARGKPYFREKESFEKSLELEEKRIALEYKKIREDEDYFAKQGEFVWNVSSYFIHAYLAKGRYVEQLECWLKYFPLKQMLIIKSEDFYENPEREYVRVQNFLGLQKHCLQKYHIHRKGSYDKKISSETRKVLQQYFEPYNERLYKLVKTNFDWR